MDKKISKINIFKDHIKVDKVQSSLGESLNDFHVKALNLTDIDADNAYQLAFNWYHITKNFSLTTIGGIGVYAKKILKQKNLNLKYLKLLQTLLSIISDDINNKNAIFNQHAPKGVRGVHFLWWKNTIVKKLKKYSNNSPTLFESTNALIFEMKKLSGLTAGAAIQLLTVETIAKQICVIFLEIFSKTKSCSGLIFKNDQDLIWIKSHISAEDIHSEEILDPDNEVLHFLCRDNKKHNNIEALAKYCTAWMHTINEFTFKLNFCA